LQLLVHGLGFFLGRGQLFIGRLQLFVVELHGFVEREHLVFGGLHLLAQGLHFLLGILQLGIEGRIVWRGGTGQRACGGILLEDHHGHAREGLRFLQGVHRDLQLRRTFGRQGQALEYHRQALLQSLAQSHGNGGAQRRAQHDVQVPVGFACCGLQVLASAATDVDNVARGIDQHGSWRESLQQHLVSQGLQVGDGGRCG